MCICYIKLKYMVDCNLTLCYVYFFSKRGLFHGSVSHYHEFTALFDNDLTLSH